MTLNGKLSPTLREALYGSTSTLTESCHIPASLREAILLIQSESQEPSLEEFISWLKKHALIIGDTRPTTTTLEGQVWSHPSVGRFMSRNERFLKALVTDGGLRDEILGSDETYEVPGPDREKHKLTGEELIASAYVNLKHTASIIRDKASKMPEGSKEKRKAEAILARIGEGKTGYAGQMIRSFQPGSRFAHMKKVLSDTKVRADEAWRARSSEEAAPQPKEERTPPPPKEERTPPPKEERTPPPPKEEAAPPPKEEAAPPPREERTPPPREERTPPPPREERTPPETERSFTQPRKAGGETSSQPSLPEVDRTSKIEEGRKPQVQPESTARLRIVRPGGTPSEETPSGDEASKVEKVIEDLDSKSGAEAMKRKPIPPDLSKAFMEAKAEFGRTKAEFGGTKPRVSLSPDVEAVLRALEEHRKTKGPAHLDDIRAVVGGRELSPSEKSVAIGKLLSIGGVDRLPGSRYEPRRWGIDPEHAAKILAAEKSKEPTPRAAEPTPRAAEPTPRAAGPTPRAEEPTPRAKAEIPSSPSTTPPTTPPPTTPTTTPITPEKKRIETPSLRDVFRVRKEEYKGYPHTKAEIPESTSPTTPITPEKKRIWRLSDDPRVREAVRKAGPLNRASLEAEQELRTGSTPLSETPKPISVGRLFPRPEPTEEWEAIRRRFLERIRSSPQTIEGSPRAQHPRPAMSEEELSKFGRKPTLPNLLMETWAVGFGADPLRSRWRTRDPVNPIAPPGLGAVEKLRGSGPHSKVGPGWSPASRIKRLLFRRPRGTSMDQSRRGLGKSYEDIDGPREIRAIKRTFFSERPPNDVPSKPKPKRLIEEQEVQPTERFEPGTPKESDVSDTPLEEMSKPRPKKSIGLGKSISEIKTEVPDPVLRSFFRQSSSLRENLWQQDVSDFDRAVVGLRRLFRRRRDSANVSPTDISPTSVDPMAKTTRMHGTPVAHPSMGFPRPSPLGIPSGMAVGAGIAGPGLGEVEKLRGSGLISKVGRGLDDRRMFRRYVQSYPFSLREAISLIQDQDEELRRRWNEVNLSKLSDSMLRRIANRIVAEAPRPKGSIVVLPEKDRSGLINFIRTTGPRVIGEPPTNVKEWADEFAKGFPAHSGVSGSPGGAVPTVEPRPQARYLGTYVNLPRRAEVPERRGDDPKEVRSAGARPTDVAPFRKSLVPKEEPEQEAVSPPGLPATSSGPPPVRPPARIPIPTQEEAPPRQSPPPTPPSSSLKGPTDQPMIPGLLDTTSESEEVPSTRLPSIKGLRPQLRRRFGGGVGMFSRKYGRGQMGQSLHPVRLLR